MRVIISSIVAATAIAGSGQAALSADMPIKAAPVAVAAPAFNWTGFYIGGNVGYGRAEKCWFSIGQAAGEGCHEPDGFLGGGQAGFNWQINSFVIGAEVAGHWTSWSASHVTPLNAIVTLRSEVEGIVTAAARIGVAFNNVLLYGKGGAAWVRDEYSESVLGLRATEAQETRTGWMVGAGLEYGFSRNWSIGIEYNYIDLGDDTLRFTPVVAPFTAFDERIDQNIHLATLRLNYRFGN